MHVCYLNLSLFLNFVTKNYNLKWKHTFILYSIMFTCLFHLSNIPGSNTHTAQAIHIHLHSAND